MAENDEFRDVLGSILNFPYDRDDSGIEKFIALNKKINALDVKKDSFAGIAVNQNHEPYVKAVKQLFPGVSYTNHSTQLKQIEQAIFKDTSLGPIGKATALTKKLGKGYRAPFIPSHIKNVYHDSGYNPMNIITGAITWITPGSFIDPALRDKPGKDGTLMFPDYDNEIEFDSHFFSNLGFSGINFKATIRDNNSCDVRIDISDCESIEITRDSNFNSTSEPDYFCGNSDKNTRINTTENNDDGICEVKKYLIAKELSDFMQIIFSIANISNEDEKHTHCMFTIDSVVASRCRLMGMQSFQQINTKAADDSVDGHSAIFRPIELDAENAEKELKKTYLESCLQNNRIVKFHLNKAIVQGFHLGGLQNPPEGSKVNNFLLYLIETIDMVSENADKIDKGMDSEEYRVEMIKHTINTPINEKGRVVTSLKRLFSPGLEIEDIEDPIYMAEKK
jgi:hypothetical protein